MKQFDWSKSVLIFIICRYKEKLPAVDVFVCTADPVLEPPCLVIGTVLSLMSYNYPSDKISVYLSDDGGSELTFYALFEASKFARYWIPFSKKHNVEPRSPEVYFSHKIAMDDSNFAQEWTSTKVKLNSNNCNCNNRLILFTERGCVCLFCFSNSTRK